MLADPDAIPNGNSAIPQLSSQLPLANLVPPSAGALASKVIVVNQSWFSGDAYTGVIGFPLAASQPFGVPGIVIIA